MTCTHIGTRYEHYLDYFQGHPIKILRDIITGEVLVDAESVAPILGFESVEDMLSDEAVLAKLNQQITRGQASPIRRIPH